QTLIAIAALAIVSATTSGAGPSDCPANARTHVASTAITATARGVVPATARSTAIAASTAHAIGAARNGAKRENERPRCAMPKRSPRGHSVSAHAMARNDAHGHARRQLAPTHATIARLAKSGVSERYAKVPA